jgi:hypothetical protein
MSHHIHLLPGIVPLNAPRKPDKKRKVRRAGVAGVSQGHEIEDVEEIFALADESEEGEGLFEDDDLQVTGGSVSGWFSGTTMKALLQAQEDR